MGRGAEGVGAGERVQKLPDAKAKVEFCPVGMRGKNGGESGFVVAGGRAAAFQAVTAYVRYDLRAKSALSMSPWKSKEIH